MITHFEQTLEKYAELIIKVGLNLKPGQRLLVGRPAPLEAAPLLRHVAALAYQQGARLVDVIFGDDQLKLIRFKNAPRDSFEEFPAWQATELFEYMRRGDAYLSIHSKDPDLLDGQDPQLISIVQEVEWKSLAPFYELVHRNASNWSVAAIALPGWAARVFPGLAPQKQVEKLWETIFKVCRLDTPDPVAAWQEHLARLSAHCALMDQKQYQALHFTAPGTDLLVGLPHNHVWRGGSITSEKGIQFTPNLPTEEVFTLPHHERVEGIVTASLPLSYGETLIHDFSLTFEAGQVVKVTAGQGETVLNKLLDTDTGARRLGEVALVPHKSPVAQAGLLFYNTLFDENAATHLALGQAYNFCLRGGESMSQEEFTAAGGNHSLVHVDFMIGSGKMDVDGLHEGRPPEAVMRGGEWVI